MKWLKKILRIIALILPAFIPLFISNSSFAKQYDIDSYSAHIICGVSNSLENRLCYNLSPEFHFNDDFETLVNGSDIKPRNDSYILASLENNHCVYQNYRNPGYTISGYDISWGGGFLSPYSTSLLPSNSDLLCQSMTPFGSGNVPEFLNSSVPFNVSINTSSMLPYHYMYSQIPFFSTRTNDGVEYSNVFHFYDMFNKPSDASSLVEQYLSSARFPINFDSSKEDLAPNSNVVFTGSFSDIGGSETSLTITTMISHNNSISSYSNGCSIEPASDINGVYYYSCVVPIDQYGAEKGRYGFSITIERIPEQTLLFFEMKSMFIILNGDSSPGGYGGISKGGSFPNVAPGTPDIDNDDADWFSSLKNMFNFNILNPFAPIFNMFINDDSCASIPIIGGMLHANETQVCPFFPSTIRQVLTPVFSMSATMLLFGYFISWLKGSSGNFFEDGKSQTIKIGGK